MDSRGGGGMDESEPKRCFAVPVTSISPPCTSCSTRSQTRSKSTHEVGREQVSLHTPFSPYHSKMSIDTGSNGVSTWGVLPASRATTMRVNGEIGIGSHLNDGSATHHSAILDPGLRATSTSRAHLMPREFLKNIGTHGSLKMTGSGSVTTVSILCASPYVYFIHSERNVRLSSS